MRKRKLWHLTDAKSGDTIAIIDPEEVESVNVPDVSKDGCLVNFKSGKSIEFQWSAKQREQNISFYLKSLIGE